MIVAFASLGLTQIQRYFCLQNASLIVLCGLDSTGAVTLVLMSLENFKAGKRLPVRLTLTTTATDVQVVKGIGRVVYASYLDVGVQKFVRIDTDGPLVFVRSYGIGTVRTMTTV